MAAAGHASPRPTFDWSDPTWMVDARCADVLDVDWFDLGCGLDEAVKLCQVCPVRGECLGELQVSAGELGNLLAELGWHIGARLEFRRCRGVLRVGVFTWR